VGKGYKAALAAGFAAAVAGLLSSAAVQSWDCQVPDERASQAALQRAFPDGPPSKGITMTEAYYKQAHGWECAAHRADRLREWLDGPRKSSTL